MIRRHKTRRKPMSEINVVPYIDVMLVLLIVFMVTAPLLVQGVEVSLPEADTAPIDETEDEPLIVSIKADGSLFINLGADTEKSRTLEEIANQVGSVMRRKPTTPVLVRGDRTVPYGRVIEVMAALQGAGAPGVGLVTDPPR